MADQQTAVTTTPTAKPSPKSPTKPQSREQSTTLRGADGATLRLVAQRQTTGAITFLWHGSAPANGTGKRVYTRGATQTWLSFEEAQARLAELVAQCEAKGWVRPVAQMPTRRPDAFAVTAIPSP